MPDLEDTTAGGAPEDGPRWGRLVLRERIGQGTSCEVHRARSTAIFNARWR